MANHSLLDQLANSFGNAVTDVREKLVEEAWFGRTAASQERMSQDVGNILGQQPEASPSGASQFDRLLNANVLQRDEATAGQRGQEPGHLSTAPERRQESVSWDQMCAQMAKAPAQEIDCGIDREMDR